MDGTNERSTLHYTCIIITQIESVIPYYQASIFVHLTLNLTSSKEIRISFLTSSTFSLYGQNVPDEKIYQLPLSDSLKSY